MSLEMKSKDPDFNRGYKEQRSGEKKKSPPASYEEGAAQAHNMGHTRERAMYAAEDEILPAKKYGSGHDMSQHGEGKSYQDHLTKKTGWSETERKNMDPETRTAIEYSHRREPKWKTD